MKVSKIIVIFDASDEKAPFLPHATQMEFENGKWAFDGPILSRFAALANEIWKLCRAEIKGE